jgi:hypothetical protein
MVFSLATYKTGSWTTHSGVVPVRQSLATTLTSTHVPSVEHSSVRSIGFCPPPPPGVWTGVDGWVVVTGRLGRASGTVGTGAGIVKFVTGGLRLKFGSRDIGAGGPESIFIPVVLPSTATCTRSLFVDEVVVPWSGRARTPAKRLTSAKVVAEVRNNIICGYDD